MPVPFRPSRTAPFIVILLLPILAAAPACSMAGDSLRLEASPGYGRAPDTGTLYALSTPVAQLIGESAESASLGGLESGSRKLIRNASLTVEVEAVAPAVSALASSAAAAGGFVLSSQEYREGKRASVVLRVPVAAFEGTVAGMEALGAVKQRRVQGEDVSEEYLDLEARIRNAEQVRARLLALLEEATTVEEMLRIEGELARLQEKIEQMRGRLTYLAHRVELATIAVELREAEAGAWPGPVTLVVRGAGWLVRQLFWIDKPERKSI